MSGGGTRTGCAQAQSRWAKRQNRASLRKEAQLQAAEQELYCIMGHPPVALQTVPQFELPRSLQVASLRSHVENNPATIGRLFLLRGNTGSASMWLSQPLVPCCHNGTTVLP
jgi:hypothetical protein